MTPLVSVLDLGLAPLHSSLVTLRITWFLVVAAFLQRKPERLAVQSRIRPRRSGPVLLPACTDFARCLLVGNDEQFLQEDQRKIPLPTPLTMIAQV